MTLAPSIVAAPVPRIKADLRPVGRTTAWRVATTTGGRIPRELARSDGSVEGVEGAIRPSRSGSHR